MSALLVDRKTLASALDVTPRRVSQLVAEGVVPAPPARGRYDLAASCKAYIADLRDRLGDATPEFARARARERTAKAELAELELQRRRAELLPADQLASAWAAWMGVLVSQLEALPARLAPAMLEAETHAEALGAAETTVRELRTRLSELPIVHEGEAAP